MARSRGPGVLAMEQPAERRVDRPPPVPWGGRRAIRHSADARAALRREADAVLAAVCVAAGLLVVDYSIVTVALPAIRSELGFTSAGLQWVVSAYALPFGGLLLVGGRAADVYGPRRTLLAGMTLFGAGLLVAGMAWDRAALLAARACQGVGAALGAPAALALVTTAHPPGPTRDRAVGIYGAMLAAGFAAGVAVGGVVTALGGWRGVFLVQLAPALGVLVLLRARLPRSAKGERGHMPAAAGALTVATFACLTYGVSQAAAVPLALGVLAGVAVVVVELRSPSPLVPSRAWRGTRLTRAAAFATVSGACAGGAVFLGTLHLRDVERYTPLATAAALLPFGLAAFAAGFLTPRAVRRLGDAGGLSACLALQGVGTSMLAIGAGIERVGVVVAGAACVGAGHVGAIVTTATVGSAEVPDDCQGSASGVLNTALETGSAIGIAVLVAVAGPDETHERALAVGGAVLLAAALTARRMG